MKGCFVTGIGTDVGKTVAAALLAEALGWAYWKPIQCGALEDSDSERVRRLAPRTPILNEVYRLPLPASPHAAAAAAGVTIDLRALTLPSATRPLIVEGAGGAMVPLNHQHLMVDLMAQLGLPVVVVAKHYLGSINHTLLTLALLKARALPVAGLLFIGDEVKATEVAIHEFSGVPVLGRVPWAPTMDRAFVKEQAKLLAGVHHVFS